MTPEYHRLSTSGPRASEARIRSRSDRRWSSDLRAWSWIVVVTPLVVVLVGAWFYHWVQEDAFINIRVIDNLIAGHGPVYNVGERVEVYSDPLWLYLVACLHVILPAVSVEWDAVLLGLVATGAGVLLAGRATQRLGEACDQALTVPVGLFIFSAVAAVWEFSTSGLEMGLVFLWVGLSFWLLTRTFQNHDTGSWCAVVVGLGPLIRPELTLMAVVLFATLALVVYTSTPETPRRIWRRWLRLVGLATVLPIAYELFRMAYFGMVVPNTALAKTASGSNWLEGVGYLWNFAAPYTLWLPLALAALVITPTFRRWWRAGNRVAVAIAVSPACAGLLDVLYVTKVGGDYMHARLLLPGFCGICVSLLVPVRDLLHARASLPLLGIALWSVVCIVWLRPPAISFPAQPVGDERTFWTEFSGHSNPMVPTDFGHTLTGQLGDYMHRLSSDTPTDQIVQVRGSPSFAAARSTLPFTLAVSSSVIGLFGTDSGPRVYIFDTNSIANPLGSHSNGATSRQGKVIGSVWMDARFDAGLGPPSPASARLTDARRALGCGPLGSYLQAITAPLGFGQIMSNIFHSFEYTTMTFSAVPRIALSELCGASATGRPISRSGASRSLGAGR